MTLPTLIFVLSAAAAPIQGNPSTGYILFLEALAQRDADKPEEALKTLQKAARVDPLAADPHAEAARIQASRRQFGPAIEAVGRAIALAPKRADLRSLAGQIHQFYSQSGGGEGQLRLAVQQYEEAARLDPQDAEPLRNLTRLYSVLRDAKAALDTWKRLSIAEPQNEDAFVQVASLSLAVGDVQGATAALETAAAANPENPRVFQLLGDVMDQTGRPEEALKNYRAAAKLDPEDLITRFKIGENLLNSKKPDEALALTAEILKQDPANRFALDLKARSLKDLKRPDEALEIAESLAASDPKDLKAAFLVVTLLEQKGAWEDAEQRLDKLVRRNTSGEEPSSVAANNRVFWAHAGMVRQRLGRFVEAAEAFGEAAKAAQDKDASLISYRIDALISAKQFDLALEEARAARKDPALQSAKDLTFLEAYALRGKGDEKGAAALVDNLVAAGSDTELLLSASDFHQRGRNFDKAALVLNSVVAKEPGNFRALFSLGAVLERQKKFDDAERAFRKALSVEPDSAMALNYLGYMNADRNVRVDEALGLIEKALESEPGNGSYLDSLAWALHRLGRNREAETAIRKAIAAQEKSAVVLSHLGVILAANGNVDEALKVLRQALETEDEDGELDRRLVEEKIRSLSKAKP